MLISILLSLTQAHAARVIKPETNYWYAGAAAESTLTGTQAPASLTLGVARDAHQAQAFLGFGSIAAGEFGIAAVYRYTLTGSLMSGLHAGGGLGMGSAGGATGFFVQIAAFGGVHFVIPQLDRILFSFDGGLSFGSVSTLPVIASGGLSPALGLSITYIFGGEP